MIGNLVTILIVLVILAVFRQLDKNNRSLEKVKRFTDKVTADLDGFIDDKTVELKNLAIELDVHHKSGKEILKRIALVEEGLSERAGDIDTIQARIVEYDNVLKELAGMTGRVDENLKRLHQESEFVDKVGRRIKEARDKIEELEHTVPSLVEEFARMNSEELTRVSAAAAAHTENRISEISEEVERCRDGVQEYSDYLSRLEERRDGLEAETLASIQESFKMLIEKAENSGDILLERLTGDINAGAENAENRLREMEQRAGAAVEHMASQFDESRARLDDSITRAAEKSGALKRDMDEYMKGLEHKGKAAGDAMFAEVKAHIDERRKDILAVFEAESTAREQEFQDLEKRIREELLGVDTSLKNRTEALASKVAEGDAEMRGYLDRVQADQKSAADEASERMEKVFVEFENQVNKRFGTLEGTVTDYEEDLSYRVSGLESISKGIDEVDAALRGSMDDMAGGLRKDMADIGKQLEQEFAAEKARADERLDSLRGAIKTLEDEISELKGKAYQNVSEKLQVFEDEFFKDLSQRNEEMQRRIGQWQQELGNELEEIAERFGNERAAYEKQAADEMKDKLSLLQNRTFQQYEKFEDQVSGFQERIDERMNLTESGFKNFEAAVQKRIEEEKTTAFVQFSKEFTDHSTLVNAQMKKEEREIEADLKKLHETVAVDRKELVGIIESARSDVTVWQAQVLQQMKDIDTDLGEHYAKLKTEANEQVSEIHQAFTEQRNDFDSFMLELQKRSKELQGEIDQRLKDFRLNIQEMREKVEAVQNKLFGKIDENYRTLQVNLQEIDKKQANFISQTKIFDRADSLKVTLGENIEDLKTEIERVGVLGKEVKEAEKKFLTIKKLGEDVSSKLTRFLTEKRRIEDMEGDFKKLINISQSVDVKLDQVTTSHDALQAIQARIRHLEELEKEVLQKYDRLEKKGDILDATTNGIDKSFQKIDDIDRELDVIQKSLSKVPEKIEDLEKRVGSLIAGKKDADEAVRRAEQLSDILNDLEKRTEKMQKAREWLAGTETRLEQINKQAQEQVKLLGNIMKEGEKSGKTAMGARDVVIKLAHQGWKAEEIARATKLSRGEVELILELIPKK